MEQRKRIAIYGGTFDPVHSGHLEVAKSVSELFAIDEFLFVPARLAPHKLARDVSPAWHRYAMLALATRDEPRLCISTIELDSQEPQYTVDTLFQFRSQFQDAADLFFVMGADSWAEITSWREWQRLLTLANLIVVTRPGYEVSTAEVVKDIATRVVDVRGSSTAQTSGMVKAGSPQVFINDAVMNEVSATAVRQAARADRESDLNKLVPLDVAAYIRKYKLYSDTQ